MPIKKSAVIGMSKSVNPRFRVRERDFAPTSSNQDWTHVGIDSHNEMGDITGTPKEVSEFVNDPNVHLDIHQSFTAHSNRMSEQQRQEESGEFQAKVDKIAQEHAQRHSESQGKAISNVDNYERARNESIRTHGQYGAEDPRSQETLKESRHILNSLSPEEFEGYIQKLEGKALGTDPVEEHEKRKQEYRNARRNVSTAMGKYGYTDPRTEEVGKESRSMRDQFSDEEIQQIRDDEEEDRYRAAAAKALNTDPVAPGGPNMNPEMGTNYLDQTDERSDIENPVKSAVIGMSKSVDDLAKPTRNVRPRSGPSYHPNHPEWTHAVEYVDTDFPAYVGTEEEAVRMANDPNGINPIGNRQRMRKLRSEEQSGEFQAKVDKIAQEHAQRHSENQGKSLDESHRYGCLMAVIPTNISSQITKWTRDSIWEKHLGPGGFENKPHITVKYGFRDPSPETVQQLKEVLSSWTPIYVKLTSLSLFRGCEDGDVLKVDVYSPELHKLNREIKSKFDCHDKFPNYLPHLTIAYLDPTFSQGYPLLNPDFLWQETMIDSLEWSGADGTKETIRLGVGKTGQKGNVTIRATGDGKFEVVRENMTVEGKPLPGGDPRRRHKTTQHATIEKARRMARVAKIQLEAEPVFPGELTEIYDDTGEKSHTPVDSTDYTRLQPVDHVNHTSRVIDTSPLYRRRTVDVQTHEQTHENLKDPDYHRGYLGLVDEPVFPGELTEIYDDTGEKSIDEEGNYTPEGVQPEDIRPGHGSPRYGLVETDNPSRVRFVDLTYEGDRPYHIGGGLPIKEEEAVRYINSPDALRRENQRIPQGPLGQKDMSWLNPTLGGSLVRDVKKPKSPGRVKKSLVIGMSKSVYRWRPMERHPNREAAEAAVAEYEDMGLKESQYRVVHTPTPRNPNRHRVDHGTRIREELDPSTQQDISNLGEALGDVGQHSMKSNYFSECERDETGHCLPRGQGSSGPKKKPTQGEGGQGMQMQPKKEESVGSSRDRKISSSKVPMQEGLKVGDIVWVVTQDGTNYGRGKVGEVGADQSVVAMDSGTAGRFPNPFIHRAGVGKKAVSKPSRYQVEQRGEDNIGGSPPYYVIDIESGEVPDGPFSHEMASHYQTLDNQEINPNYIRPLTREEIQVQRQQRKQKTVGVDDPNHPLNKTPVRKEQKIGDPTVPTYGIRPNAEAPGLHEVYHIGTGEVASDVRGDLRFPAQQSTYAEIVRDDRNIRASNPSED